MDFTVRAGHCGKLLEYVKQNQGGAPAAGAAAESEDPDKRPVTYLLSVSLALEKNGKKITNEQARQYVLRLRRRIKCKVGYLGVVWKSCGTKRAITLLDFFSDLDCPLDEIKERTQLVMAEVTRLFAEQDGMVLNRDYRIEYMITEPGEIVRLESD